MFSDEVGDKFDFQKVIQNCIGIIVLCTGTKLLQDKFTYFCLLSKLSLSSVKA